MGNTYAFRVFAENKVGKSETAAVTKNAAHIQKTGKLTTSHCFNSAVVGKLLKYDLACLIPGSISSIIKYTHVHSPNCKLFAVAKQCSKLPC